MPMIDDYTNPLTILSLTDALMISKKEYQFLKQIAKIERETIIKNNNQIDNFNLIQKLTETLTNSSIYPNLSISKKQIILSNAILPDDTNIINTLSEYGFTIYHLKTIIRFRSIIKNLLINECNLTQELKDNITIYKKVTNKLIDIFNKEFNCNNSTIILNRISEMLITQPDLFKNNNSSNKLIKNK